MKKFENFCRALDNLADIYTCDEPYNTVTTTGLVGLFEICFEQSWKAMKEILTDQGISESQTGSPRKVLKSAYQAGMIRDEDLWLDAFASRNNVAHAYNQDIALSIIQRIKSDYYDMFCRLKEEIESNWL